MYDTEWLAKEKKVDSNFDGSLEQQIGLTKYLCPTCGSHLSQTVDGNIICLNMCHLTPASRERMITLMHDAKRRAALSPE